MVTEEDAALEKAARLGAPSCVWRAGQQRRLDIVRRYVPLEGRRILDVGCGVGMYLRAFQRYSPSVLGIEIDHDRAGHASAIAPVLQARAESLPLREGSLDVVFLNEVLEHVADDRRAVAEATRALRRGGHIVIYLPNRRYPFETHGVYWKGRYHFGNFLFVNYLPDRLRDRLVPHARAYTWTDLRRTFEGLPLRIVHRGYVFPGFDNVKARSPFVADLLRRVLYALEQTPLRAFGLSHFLVLEKL